MSRGRASKHASRERLEIEARVRASWERIQPSLDAATAMVIARSGANVERLLADKYGEEARRARLSWAAAVRRRFPTWDGHGDIEAWASEIAARLPRRKAGEDLAPIEAAIALPSDRALVERWREMRAPMRDAATLILKGDGLVEGYGPEVSGFFAGTLRDDGAAFEAFQEWSVKVWEGLPSFRWTSSVRVWAFSIAHRTLQGLRRSRGRKLKREAWLDTNDALELSAAVWTRTRPHERTDAKNWLTRQIEALPAIDRQLLILRIEQEMTYAEIAAVLGAEPGKGDPAARLRKRCERLINKLRGAREGATAGSST
jgi:RNA polymerase sigma factor (sigma-70 family)